MLERARRSDRLLALAIGTVYVVGIVLCALSIWFLLADVDPPESRLVGKMIISGILVGPVFVAIATGELVHRLRHGPQAPGRHAADVADR